MSDWKERSNKRRDERNTKVSDEPKKKKSKKDTKTWCKGKVGIEHTPKCMPYKNYTGSMAFKGWKELCCTQCGKILDTYYPMWFAKRPKPDWVV